MPCGIFDVCLGNGFIGIGISSGRDGMYLSDVSGVMRFAVQQGKLDGSLQMAEIIITPRACGLNSLWMVLLGQTWHFPVEHGFVEVEKCFTTK